MALDPILASALYALSEALTTIARQTRRGDHEQADAALRAIRALLTLALRLGADVSAEPLPGHVSAADSLPTLLEWVSAGIDDRPRGESLLHAPWLDLVRACSDLVSIEEARDGAEQRAA
jgi:hypothetical protein